MSHGKILGGIIALFSAAVLLPVVVAVIDTEQRVDALQTTLELWWQEVLLVSLGAIVVLVVLLLIVWTESV